MVPRKTYDTVLSRLALFPAVILLGPKQAGQTLFQGRSLPDVRVFICTLNHGLTGRSCLTQKLVLSCMKTGWLCLMKCTVFPNCSIRTVFSSYRTSTAAEIGLVMELPDGEIWAIEIKSGRSATPSRGFCNACEDVQPNRSFIVYAGEERYHGFTGRRNRECFGNGPGNPECMPGAFSGD